MENKEIIGLMLVIVGFALEFLHPIGLLIFIAGVFVYGKSRLGICIFALGLAGLIINPQAFVIALVLMAVGGYLIYRSENGSIAPSLTKEGRSSINPFTGKRHYDRVNDDEFLAESYQQYYQVVNQSQLFDNTEQGQLMMGVATNLISAVENHLKSIGRSDYTQNYYDWDVHLIGSDVINAYCMPGGKIAVFTGLFSVIHTEEDLAFILGHEMAHALLDHSRTQASAQKTKNRMKTGARLGSVALSLAGFGTAASVTNIATNVADVGSHYFLMKPWGRDQEYEADKLGMMIIHWAGYDIRRVPEFWTRMTGGTTSKSDFFSTHPADSKRLKKMNQLVPEILNREDFTSKPVMK